MRMALKLILVTGQRREIIGMTWDDIHGEVWVIPEHRHKTEEDGQRVPLTPLALELVEAIRAEQAASPSAVVPYPEHLFTKGQKPLLINALSRHQAQHKAPRQ